VKNNNLLSPKEFHASDLFNKWKTMINKADTSIQIFTPYLDNTIIQLINDAGTKVNITIITCLDGESLFQRGYQLNALKEAIHCGVLIKNLVGLHAKVLLIDNKYISLGSQNFTKRGRLNKEAGMISDISFQGSELLSTLRMWVEESKFVSLDLLNKLSNFLDENEDEITALKNKFDNNIEKIISEFNQIEIENQILNSKYYNSTYRFAQGEVILTKTAPPPNYDYYSFFAGESNNLCQWIKTNVNGVEEQVDFIDYYYYSALNISTMEMAFLRIHTSRITFTKSDFMLEQSNGYEIGELKFELKFSFLKSKTKVSNMKVSLKNNNLGEVTLYYLFDGANVRTISDLYQYHNDNTSIL
jgi:hypothetical protein